MPRHIDAPETALLIKGPKPLTQAEAKVLERDVARVGRAYGRAHARVRTLKAQLRKAIETEKELRRQMRLLISARR